MGDSVLRHRLTDFKHLELHTCSMHVAPKRMHGHPTLAPARDHTSRRPPPITHATHCLQSIITDAVKEKEAHRHAGAPSAVINAYEESIKRLIGKGMSVCRS